MKLYIHQLPGWPAFKWDPKKIGLLLAEVRHAQGRLLGRMHGLGFDLRAEASLKILTLDVVKSSEIEGEILDESQVRSSIARRLGMDIAGLVPADRNVEGVVEMMLDATQLFEKPISEKRIYKWHKALFEPLPGRRNMMVIGSWRQNIKSNPMQAISGPIGKEKVHFTAPDSGTISNEMQQFFVWFNEVDATLDPILKAAIAHLWFITIHPFDDGNGRIARAIADMQLARADGSAQRFYSMSAQIRKERNAYYEVLEKTQKGSLDITVWLEWFINCLARALETTNETLRLIFTKVSFWKLHGKTILNSRQLLMLNKLLDGFTGKLNSSKWATIAKCSADTALRDIQDLMDKNILIKEDGGGRSTSYLLVE